MNPLTRGIRNAFRNGIRTTSIVIILGIAMGLALSMLIANKAVSQKISDVKSSVGNTVTISPAGFSNFSSVNNSLTTTQLASVSKLANVSSVEETLTDRLQNENSTTSNSSFGGPGGQSSTSSTAKTSLTSPVTINLKGGGHFFFGGGSSSSTSTTTATTFTQPVTIEGTNTPTSVSGTAINIISGKTISPTADNKEAVISSQMASKNNLKVGSTFTAYGDTLTVSGISKTSDKTLEGTVIVSLATEQAISGETGDVTSATATVNSLDNLSSVTTAIKSTLGSKADVTSSQEEADETVAPLNSVKSVSLYSLIGAIIAGGVIILLTMVMIVRERTREIGVIKAIGGSNLKIATQFMTEAITLTMMGAVIGILLGIVAASPITNTLVKNSSSTTSTTQTAGPGGAGGGFGGGAGGGFGGGARTGTSFTNRGHGALGGLHNNITNIHAAVGWSILIYGFLSAIVIALIGSGFISLFISRIRPAEVIRSE
jgi:putative ABC transport system permease protein